MLELNIFYDNLLIDILSVWWYRKKYRNHSCESFCYVNDNFDKNAKMHVQPERLYFLFAFCARHYPWWSLWPKNTKNNDFIQVKPLLLVVVFSNTVTFWRNARFGVIFSLVTIIRQVLPSQIVLLWVTCWHRSIKTLKHLFVDTSYSLGSSDVITNVNTMTPINPLFFLRKFTADAWLFKMKLWKKCFDT